MKKMPPAEKVFEAWTSIADGRIKMHEGHAVVASSDGTKEYTVRFSGNRYSSDDNATYWQGYPGYPVIAVLMLQGRLPEDKEEIEKWKDVNWKEINTRYKNRYAEAVREVAQQRGINLEQAYAAAGKILEDLGALDIEIKRKI